MERILISACLVGDNVKYDGGNNKNPLIEKLLEKYELVPFCPEVEGGLPTPRHPAEQRGEQVINDIDEDVTDEFERGADLALNICLYLKIKKAILKALDTYKEMSAEDIVKERHEKFRAFGDFLQ